MLALLKELEEKLNSNLAYSGNLQQILLEDEEMLEKLAQ
jgi:hypothetical protein